ncbi:MAG: HAMP domain-containing histidine kinase [Gammaproteobacteria bacterium]|nr:HAMP domain-containing histidine kinase [Gammaproteobacteria bacterium]
MSQTAPISKQQLEQAFQLFTQASQRLADSYTELQLQVEKLNLQLAAANSGRMQQLAEKERYAHRFALLLDTLPAAVLVLDSAGRVLQFNPAAGALFAGLSQGDAWEEIYRSQVRMRQDDELHLHTGRVVSISRQALQDDEEQILLLLDITAALELKQRAQRQQRLSAMGQMAAQLAHQIRTPLSAALLYSTHLGRGDLSADQRQRFADSSRTALLQMEQQINDMLAFTRGADVDRSQQIDLTQLTSEVNDTLAPLAAEHGLTLGLEIETATPATIRGNRSALLGAVINLGRNALEHCGQGGEVRLRLTESGEEWRLLVSDDGPGVPEALRERIFDPFFTTRSQGTGLGLAVTQAVLLGHGGSVSVERNGSGGARFIAHLPKAENAVATDAEEPANADDTPILRRAV